tara:strand:- start:651 stop:1046 length:396 start_codon:yes stop_codon:yes gene_type:complete
MAHFVKLNGSNLVTDVYVIADADCLDASDNESEAVGIAFCETLLGSGTYKQTSYNGNIRKRYGAFGYKYDATKNAYIEPQPYASWTNDSNGAWQPPIVKPSDTSSKVYQWDETAYQADNSTGWVAKLQKQL